ncbi:MAG: PAS domain S-box protein [SAR324 cluster bacterium]|nr:PAS domain S-box protein [SAR324 cluster bacterium]
MNDSEKTRAELLDEVTALRKKLAGLEQRSAPESGESAARLAQIMDTAEDAIISFDAGQRILQFNKGAERIFGHAPADMIGRPLDDLLPGQTRGVHGKHFHMFAESPESSRAMSGRSEIQGLRKNGKIFPAEASISKIGHGDDKIFTVFLRDITQRVEASRELEASREAARQAHALLLDAIESLPGSFALYDAEDRLVLTNRKTLEFFPDHAPILKPGVKYEDIIRLSFDKNLIPFDGERKEETIRERVRENRASEGMIEQSWNDGRWFELYHRKTSDGGIVSIRMDITARKKAEEERTASQRLLQTIFDALPIGVCVKDLESRYRMVNKAFAKYVNRAPEEMIGLTSQDFHGRPEEERQRVIETDRYVLESGNWYDDPGELFTFSDGTQRWRRIIKGPIHDEDGRIVGILGIREDIHERKQAEEELRENRRLLQAIFDTVPYAIMVKNLKGQYMMANRVLGNWFEMRPEDMLGLTADDLPFLSDRQKARIRETDREMHAANRLIEYSEFPLTIAGGKEIIQRIIKMPLNSESGEVIGHLSIAEDITERKRAEKALKESEALLQVVFDSYPDWLYVKDKEKRFLKVNQSMADFYGLSPEKFKNKVFHDFSFDWIKEKDLSNNSDNSVLESGKTAHIPEYEMHDQNGKIHIHNLTKIPLKNQEGDIMGIIGISQDITERYRAEEALRESEEKIRGIMDHSTAVIILKDVKGRFLLVNRRFEEMHGITAENVIGKTSFDVLPEEEAKKVMAQEEMVLKTGKPVEREQEITNVDGIHRMISIKFPVFSPTGEIIGIGTTGTDITERKQAEEALRKNERLLQTVFDSIHHILFAKDINSKFLMVNRAYAERYNLAPEDFIGTHVMDLPIGTPEEKRRFLENDRLVLESGKRHEDHDFQITQLDGKVSHFNNTYLPLHGDQGEVVGLVGVSEDITERKRAEKALGESEAKFRDLVETSQNLIWRLDTEARFIYLNPAWEEALGYTLEEMLGRRITDFKDPGDTEETLSAHQEILGGKTLLNRVATYLTKTGEKRVFNFVAKPSIDAEGNIVGAQGTAHDITGRRMLEDQLRQSQKMEALGTLAGGIAHDFNNILAPIMGYAEIMVAKADPGSRDQDNLNTILRSAVRAKDLVSQILLFSRRVESEKKPSDLVPVVKDVFRLARSTFSKSILVVEEIAEGTAPVVCDPNQIHQALLNLCVNAGQALTDGGEVKIMIDRVQLHQAGDFSGKQFTGDFVRLSVSDTGVGMDEDTLRQIFDPFFTTKEVGQGTGLGLSTVFGIVREHGGGIFVYSQPGQGSLFEMVLPAAEFTGRESVETAALAPNGRERILFVDDEQEIVRLSKSILEDFGYRVTVTSDSNQALRIFLDSPADFDLVITDQSMPRMKGEGLAKELRRAKPDIPIIICTGHSDYMTPEYSQQKGIDAFLYKPFSANQLGQVVRDVLDRRIAGG